MHGHPRPMSNPLLSTFATSFRKYLVRYWMCFHSTGVPARVVMIQRWSSVSVRLETTIPLVHLSAHASRMSFACPQLLSFASVFRCCVLVPLFGSSLGCSQLRAQVTMSRVCNWVQSAPKCHSMLQNVMMHIHSVHSDVLFVKLSMCSASHHTDIDAYAFLACACPSHSIF